jgi:hypothetical protein
MIRVVIDVQYARQSNARANIDQSREDDFGIPHNGSFGDRYRTSVTNGRDFAIDANNNPVFDHFSRDRMDLLASYRNHISRIGGRDIKP